MGRVLLTVKLDPAHATLDEVRKRLRIAASNIDESFGVVSIDPEAQLFAVLVDEAVAGSAERDADVAGSYSNPRIDGFGPPIAPDHR